MGQGDHQDTLDFFIALFFFIHGRATYLWVFIELLGAIN